MVDVAQEMLDALEVCCKVFQPDFVTVMRVPSCRRRIGLIARKFQLGGAPRSAACEPSLSLAEHLRKFGRA